MCLLIVKADVVDVDRRCFEDDERCKRSEGLVFGKKPKVVSQLSELCM